jgi:hypothetical protein
MKTASIHKALKLAKELAGKTTNEFTFNWTPMDGSFKTWSYDDYEVPTNVTFKLKDIFYSGDNTFTVIYQVSDDYERILIHADQLRDYLYQRVFSIIGIQKENIRVITEVQFQ